MTKNEKIYREFYPKVTAYIRSRTSRSDVEDIVSGIFLKVYSNLDRFDEKKASLSTWIYTISRNALYDHMRSAKNIPVPLEDVHISVKDNMNMDELLDDLAESLKALPANQRDAVMLYYYFGLSHREIAEKMSISYPSARKLCSTAVANLRKKMTV